MVPVDSSYNVLSLTNIPSHFPCRDTVLKHMGDCRMAKGVGHYALQLCTRGCARKPFLNILDALLVYVQDEAFIRTTPPEIS